MKIRITKKGLPKAQWLNSEVGKATQNQIMGVPSFPTNPSLNYTPMGLPEYKISMEDKIRYGAPVYASDFKNADEWEAYGRPKLSNALKKTSATTEELKENPFNKFGKKLGAYSALATGLINVGNFFTNYFGNQKKLDEDRGQQYLNNLNPQATEMFRGNYMTNSGVFQPNKLPTPNEGMFAYGGQSNINPMKIRITEGPKMMAYGGQSGYGLDIGQRKVFTDMPEDQQESISSSIRAVPRYAANIEAEGGETVYGDMDGDGGLEHFKISGPRHSEGGVPLNVPEGSFIFSDTRKMKIKDPEILKMFGKTYKKGGYTPASIAKQYDINKYKAIMEDPYADPRAKATAQLMVKNYQDKLGLLSIVQEGIKDFPQGIPAVAQAAVGATQMAYGGYTTPLPKYQKKGQVKLGAWSDDYEKLKELLLNDQNLALRTELYNRYLQSRGAGKKMTQDEFINNLLEAQRQAYTINNMYIDSPATLNEDSWDKGGLNTRYRKEATKAGLTPLTDDQVGDFQSAFLDLQDLMEDPRFQDSFGKYFETNPQGKSDQTYKGKPISGSDKWWGNTTNRQFLRLRGAQPVPSKEYFICTGRSEGGAPVFSSAIFATAEEAAKSGYSASKDEAAKYCGLSEIPPGELPQGVPKKIPFDYMMPDKVNMLANALYPPQVYMPYSRDLQFTPGQYALPDWLSQAQQIQQTYNTTADTMGVYGAPQALASNLSFASGQAADAVGQVIANNAAQSTGIYNQFAANELARKDKVDLYNTMNAKDRWDASTIARQQFDNSRRKYVRDLAKGFSNAWNNRMNLGLINVTNPLYNIDPDTGYSYFVEGYGPNRFGSARGAVGSTNADLLKKFTSAKNRFRAADMSESLAEKLATQEVYGVGTTTMTDANMDGYPDNMRMTGPSNIFGGYPFGFPTRNSQ